MRTFIILYIAVTLALTASAAIIGKRATSAPANECVGLVSHLEDKIIVLSSSFRDYVKVDTQDSNDTATASPPDVESQKKIGDLFKSVLSDSISSVGDFDSAREKCCAIASNPAVKEEDSKAISNQIGRFGSIISGAIQYSKFVTEKFDKYREYDAHLEDVLNKEAYLDNSVRECFARGASPPK